MSAQDISRLTNAAFLVGYRALERAVDDLGLNWEATKPIQGERATKVLAFRCIDASVPLILDDLVTQLENMTTSSIDKPGVTEVIRYLRGLKIQ